VHEVGSVELGLINFVWTTSASTGVFGSWWAQFSENSGQLCNFRSMFGSWDWNSTENFLFLPPPFSVQKFQLKESWNIFLFQLLREWHLHFSISRLLKCSSHRIPEILSNADGDSNHLKTISFFDSSCYFKQDILKPAINTGNFTKSN